MRLRFEAFVADTDLLELRRAGEPVPLQPKVLRLLLYLLEHRGRVVSKHELLNALWGDAHVSEGSLARALSLLRQALGGGPQAARILRTLHGHGYRIDVPVTVEPDSERVAPVHHGRDFVGRARELGEARRCLADAFAGAGQILLLAGDPGVGKTRLAQAIAEEARGRGAQVLWGRCWEAEDGLAYWPWIQIVRARLRAGAPDVLARELGPGAADLAEVVPEVREKLTRLSAPAPLEPALARFRFFDSMTSFLQRAARETPLVLVLDDLHKADESSLLLLQFLAEGMAEARLLVLGTYRDRALAPGHPLARTLAELSRAPHAKQSLHLHGLSSEEVAQYVDRMAPREAPERLVREIHAKTDGNPLFVREIVGWLLGRDPLGANREREASIEIPPALQHVILQRVAALPEPCQRVLRLASVIGREFAVQVLASAAALPVPATLEDLWPAEAEGLVEELPGTSAQFRFSHALVRENLYGALAAPERVKLHRRVAQALETHAERNAAHDAQLAHHWCAALDVQNAVAACIRAARSAMAGLAFEEAAAHFVRALELQEVGGHADPGVRCDLLLELADAQYGADDRNSSAQTYLRAAELARSVPDAARLGRAALGFAGAYPLPGAPQAGASALLQEALAALGEQPSALRARLLARLAFEQTALGEPEQGQELMETAAAAARVADDPATSAYVLRGRRRLFWTAPEQTLAEVRQIVQLAEQAGDRYLAFLASTIRVGSLLELGELEAADAEVALLGQRLEEQRSPLLEVYPHVYRATQALLSGRYAEAETRVAQLLTHVPRYLRGRMPAGLMLIFLSLFELRRSQGRLAELEGGVQQYLQQFPGLTAWRSALAFLYAEIDRPEQACAAFEQLARDGFADLCLSDQWLMQAALLAEVCAFLGDAQRAEPLAALLQPYAHLNAVAGYVGVCWGSVSRSLGRLHTVLGRWETAERCFEDALVRNRRLGARPWVAQTHHDYARMLRARGRRGDRARAREQVQQGLAIATELGMPALEAKLRTLEPETGQPARREAG